MLACRSSVWLVAVSETAILDGWCIFVTVVLCLDSSVTTGVLVCSGSVWLAVASETTVLDGWCILGTGALLLGSGLIDHRGAGL